MSPARALLPSLVTAAKRPVLEKLNKIAGFSLGFEGSFSKLGLETISQPQEADRCYAAVYEHKVNRKLLEPSSGKHSKPQIADLNMLDPALTQTETSSLVHFEKARDVRPCHCTSYSVMSPDENTFLVVWKFEDLHHLGGTPPDRTVIPYVLSADMALLYLVKHGPFLAQKLDFRTCPMLILNSELCSLLVS